MPQFTVLDNVQQLRPLRCLLSKQRMRGRGNLQHVAHIPQMPTCSFMIQAPSSVQFYYSTNVTAW
ncbi:hypothetical protein COCSUDRAFT_34579 [Coccomyxa subellipsoidea C-169]|uniref:Uncharacterized protein n=1 Tax=Coccomyxa subellipsoidea (strain C-169) TaxID=574566 RepID=I0YIK9_COCSC|nr:hypothetical protein COCSUDRAFT_34579 [Coccomyxa subellipsoidea C-169]EIE18228.1 hypothetical protein COCSUDRAFT_34579 [Coccomyxa subellipsoidea C-169]|eukprot:XP_005642772.1 hypothetical protein COCSUDRAFT_34579 [Coccomyxa subellipsoidea C-169]